MTLNIPELDGLENRVRKGIIGIDWTSEEVADALRTRLALVAQMGEALKLAAPCPDCGGPLGGDIAAALAAYREAVSPPKEGQA